MLNFKKKFGSYKIKLYICTIMNQEDFSKLVKILISSTKKYGLQVKRNDKHYLVLESLYGHVIVPKTKTDEFVRIFVVEYGEHIVKQFFSTHLKNQEIYYKFIKYYKRYFNAKNISL